MTFGPVFDELFAVLDELRDREGFDECGYASGYLWGRRGLEVVVTSRAEADWFEVTEAEWRELGVKAAWPANPARFEEARTVE
jgi:hypothetical protein